jgi:hypothetical protein
LEHAQTVAPAVELDSGGHGVQASAAPVALERNVLATQKQLASLVWPGLEVVAPAGHEPVQDVAPTTDEKVPRAQGVQAPPNWPARQGTCARPRYSLPVPAAAPASAPMFVQGSGEQDTAAEKTPAGVEK